VVAEIERFGVGKRLTDFIVHGDTIHFSGYVAEEAAGKSVTEQTRDILAQIDGSLGEAGSDKSKLIEATIWLADMATFGEMNAVWDAWVERALASKRGSPRRSTPSRSGCSPRVRTGTEPLMKKKSSIGGRRPPLAILERKPVRRRDLTFAGDPDWPTESPRLTLIDIFPVLAALSSPTARSATSP